LFVGSFGENPVDKISWQFFQIINLKNRNYEFKIEKVKIMKNKKKGLKY